MLRGVSGGRAKSESVRKSSETATVARGPAFPHSAQAVQIVRRRRTVTTGKAAWSARCSPGRSRRNLAIGALRLTGCDNIAAGLRKHGRDSTRPLATLGIT